MTTVHKWYNQYSKSELLDIARVTEENEKNHEPPGGLFRLTPNARKKLAAIEQAIAWHMEDARNLVSRPVPVCGYSGRLTNPRR